MLDNAEFESDNTMTEEAVRFLLRGQGQHKTDGFALEAGYVVAVVKPFGKVGVDVWFHRSDCAGLPCFCSSHHVEFGRTGGELLILEKGVG